jgi:GNAT superfamily N-acetyltransferase
LGFIVKEADIDTEKEVLLRILEESRNTENYSYDIRYDWLYKFNPFGKATAWIIWDEEKGIPAGFTAVYPRKMLVNGREYLCWNCGDFSVDKRYRSLGVAVKLRKEAKRYVDEGTIPFLYAHPNDRMVHVHLRAKHKKIGHMHRYAFPIRISNYLGSNSVGKLSGAIMDPLVQNLIRFAYRRTGDFENLDVQSVKFNESHSELCQEISRQLTIIGLRDETYLNWKYKNHPIVKYSLFNYYESNKLAGYIIYRVKDNVIYMFEIVSRTNVKMQENLLSTFINFCVTNCKNIKVISAVVFEFHPIVSVLNRERFKYRNDATSSVIAYCAEPKLKDFVEDGKNWYMTVGDRDS